MSSATGASTIGLRVSNILRSCLSVGFINSIASASLVCFGIDTDERSNAVFNNSGLVYVFATFGLFSKFITADTNLGRSSILALSLPTLDFTNSAYFCVGLLSDGGAYLFIIWSISPSNSFSFDLRSTNNALKPISGVSNITY